MWVRDIVQSFNNCKKRCNAVLKVSFLERLHQEASARYFLFHSDFQLNRPQISQKTVTKFQSSQTFAYRGCKVEIDCDELDRSCIYAACVHFVNRDRGCAVVLPNAVTTRDGIRRAKLWFES